MLDLLVEQGRDHRDSHAERRKTVALSSRARVAQPSNPEDEEHRRHHVAGVDEVPVLQESRERHLQAFEGSWRQMIDSAAQCTTGTQQIKLGEDAGRSSSKIMVGRRRPQGRAAGGIPRV